MAGKGLFIVPISVGHPRRRRWKRIGASRSVLSQSKWKRLGRLLKSLGPGLITGASDDDPSGIATYAAAGAALGYATLWTALVTYPLMAAVQYICSRVGMVSGRGLAGVLRRHYPRWLLYPVVICLLAANTLNAGVDLGAIAAGLELFVPLPMPVLVVPVTLLILALQVW